MYAIIQVGGNQYKVEIGQEIEVDRLDNKVGDILKFPSFLIVDGEKVLVAKKAEEVLVSVKVLEHIKGEKLDVSRFHHKTRHRRHIGFRPSLTKIQIQSIGTKEVKIEKKPVKTVKKTTKIKKTA